MWWVSDGVFPGFLWHFPSFLTFLHQSQSIAQPRTEFKYKRILQTTTSYVTGGYEPSCSWMGPMNLLTQLLSVMFLKCTVDSASSSCSFTLFMCCIWVHLAKGHWNDCQMEDANRGHILVWWSSLVRSFICAQSGQLKEIFSSPACRNRNCDWLFPWLFHLWVSRTRCSRHSLDLKV